MSFLNPAAIAMAAALTIPPLVAMYFLKLKRTVRVVPTTLLWKKSVEDLQVNSPFQRLRSSLLLLLQLLILVVAAIALGKPMFQTAETNEGTIIIMIDQSASMDILEADGKTRLDKAKEQAKRQVDNMDDQARAMVFAFCDRAIVISSFDTNRQALKRKIDTIETTQSSSTLSEAMEFAEAYSERITIGTEEAGRDIAPESAAPPASVFIFTDGRIEDAQSVSLQRFELADLRITTIGSRSDNVGILSMDARRNYERPESLEVTATVRNFGDQPVALDVVLYVAGDSVDVQTVSLAPGLVADPNSDPDAVGMEESTNETKPPESGSVRVIAFDEIEYDGGGVVEVALSVDDAMTADNRAWTIIDPPRHLQVLLVGEGNIFLQNVLSTLPLTLETMTGEEYEEADDNVLMPGERSAFDVVILDRHSTSRLPQGNYFFWGAVPKIDGVSSGAAINDQVIFNWDDVHPILRHVSVETLYVYEWLDLTLPPEAIPLVEGETSHVISYLTRDANQFLICAFSLIAEDDDGNSWMNTHWVTSVDFVVFVQNAVQYLASNIASVGKREIRPGQPVTLPYFEREGNATIHRPDGTTDQIPSAGSRLIPYARTRQVGTYRMEPGKPGHDLFAVNLFNANESFVQPTSGITISAERIEASSEEVEVAKPAWRYFLLAILVLLVLEWVIYNQRVLI